MISGHAYCSAVRRARPPDQNCCWMHYAKAPTPVMSRPIGGPGKQARRSPEDGPSPTPIFIDRGWAAQAHEH
jgi:hypothetical protein